MRGGERKGMLTKNQDNGLSPTPVIRKNSRNLSRGPNLFYRWCLLLAMFTVLLLTKTGFDALASHPLSYDRITRPTTNNYIEQVRPEIIIQAEVGSSRKNIANGNYSLSTITKARKKAKNDDGNKASWPNVVWLMSFPNSGTTYTNKLIQSISQTTTATNYGVEQSGYSTSIPIKPNLTEGPFFRFPKRNYSKYILTKTHCGAYCSRCSPERYIVNAGRFGADCRSGNKLENGKQLSINQAYSSSLVKKAVHIIRNPFNNIVSRLRYQHKTWADRPDREEFLRLFQADQQGFRRWCQFLDYSTRKTFTSDLLDNKTKELYPLIPCPAEFYRYVQWHNLATEITEKRMRIPVLSLFYENYTESYNDTVNQLLDFLELEAVSDPSPFIEGKEYPDYFTDDEKYYAGILAKHLATTKTWSLIGHYFENFMDR